MRAQAICGQSLPGANRRSALFPARASEVCVHAKLRADAQCGNCAWRSMPNPRAEDWKGCDEAHKLHVKLPGNPERAVHEMHTADRTMSAAGQIMAGTLRAVDPFAAA